MKVPAGYVWFIGGYRKWMPMLVIWCIAWPTGRKLIIELRFASRR